MDLLYIQDLRTLLNSFFVRYKKLIICDCNLLNSYSIIIYSKVYNYFYVSLPWANE